MTNTLAIAVLMGDNDNFVAELKQRLRQLVEMHFNATHVWKAKVSAHGNAIATFAFAKKVNEIMIIRS